MTQSFSAFCAELGAPLYNKAWSWCARSPERRLALFTVWEDRIDSGQYVFTTEPRAGERRQKPGRTELIAALDEVIADGWAGYGIQCRAADIDAMPRKRRSFDRERLLDLRITRAGDRYVGRIVGHIVPHVVSMRGHASAWLASAAIDDIEADERGNSDPEYKKRMAGSYVRDDKVRRHVLKRARGVCEFCGSTGFRKRDGAPYLETHHVISLSEQGPDKLHNVIALCANDHRRAHFGDDWAQLQEAFLTRLQCYRKDRRSLGGES